MKPLCDLRLCLLWALALLCSPVPHALAEADMAPGSEVVRAEGEYSAEEERAVETREQKGGSVGYGLFSREGNAGRAAPYSYLHSSALGSLFYRRLEKDLNVELDGSFLNPKEYQGDLLLDYRGDYRLHLRTESLFHNLDRETLLPATSFLGAANDPLTGFVTAYGTRQDPPDGYGLSITQDLAHFRYRLHNFPLHVNLGWWRLVREGTVQQRFADASFEGAGTAATPAALLASPPNLVFGQARQVEQWTQEATASIDAHLGWVEAVYSFRARDFEDRVPTPTHGYLQRNDSSGTGVLRAAGVQQHNENPDSRFFSHTVKLHTSVSGGLVASGSYSLDQRENLSRLTDTAGVRHHSEVQNAAADLSYTPFKELTLAVKYRRQEVEKDNPASITNAFFADPIALRPAIDTVKDQVTATASYRPTNTLTLNGEYRGDFVQRNHVSAIPGAFTWGLPERTDTSRGSFSVLYRPVRGARLTAKYSYTSTDHPAYGNAYQTMHEGELLASYLNKNRWGGSASFLERRGKNDDIRRFPIDFSFNYLEPVVVSGDREVRNGSLALWYTPVERVTLSANYAYLSTEASQPVIFGSFLPAALAGSDFFSRSHVYGVNATFAATQALDLSLMLQQTRSHTAFTPQLVAFDETSDTSGIRQLNEQDSVLSTVSARGEYRFNSRFSGSLEYTWRDYDESNALYSAYNGSVHAVAAWLSASW